MPRRRVRTIARRFALAAIAVALAGCASRREAEVVDRSWEPRPAQRTAPMPRTARREHVVVRGDTLHAISFEHGVSVRDLAAWNAIAPPYTIYPGQRLRVGPASVSPQASPARRYPVRPVRPIDRASANRYPPPPRRAAEPVRAPRRAPPEPLPPRAGAAITTPLDDGNAPEPRTVVSRPSPPEATSPRSAEPSTIEARRATMPTPESEPERAPAIAAAPTRSAAGIAWRWPAKGAVSSRFRAGDPSRQGIDIRGRDGDLVVAAADGEIVYSGSGLLGYGELVIVKHAGEFLSAYAYNRKRLVAEGERVRAGQPIAEMGRRGGALDLVHFEIRRGGQPVDPLQFLPPR